MRTTFPAAIVSISRLAGFVKPSLAVRRSIPKLLRIAKLEPAVWLFVVEQCFLIVRRTQDREAGSELPFGEDYLVRNLSKEMS